MPSFDARLAKYSQLSSWALKVCCLYVVSSRCRLFRNLSLESESRVPEILLRDGYFSVDCCVNPASFLPSFLLPQTSKVSDVEPYYYSRG